MVMTSETADMVEKVVEEAAKPNPNPGFVTALGVGTVFVGLICIVVLCWIMGVVVRTLMKNPAETKAEPQKAAAPAAPAVIENKQEFVAAVSAAIAEDMGTDINGIRIHSIKQL